MIFKQPENKIPQFIIEQLIDKLNLAYFSVDQDMRVCDVSSNLQSYGFSELVQGELVENKIDFMIGMEVNTTIDLPVVSSPSGVPLSVTLAPSGNRLTVLLLDVTDSTEQRRLLQQAANENELLVERQKKLVSELEKASLLLENKNQLLEDASRLQTGFLSGVSHEFRTPLSSIIGYTDLVKRKLENSDLEEIKHDIKSLANDSVKNIDCLDAIQRSSKHLMSLVENLLDHGKFDSNEIMIRPKSVSLVDVFNDVSLVLKPLSDTKYIGLQLDYDFSNSGNVVLDDSRLRQCLINLVGNAIKFTDTGFVRLSASLDNENLHVSIQDTGVGISKEDLQKIRLPFYQAANTGKVGTGLGLTITERIIEMMGGSLNIDSVLGKGTTVRFDLPAPNIDNQKVHQQGLAEAKNSAAGMRFLLAEDDQDIADLVVMLLTEKNVDVVHVSNGVLAVEAIQNNNFDLVLMDIHMPLMTGYEAIEQLNELGCKTPIVIMSASAIDADQDLATELGCEAYLIKPVDVDEIIEMALTIVQ